MPQIEHCEQCRFDVSAYTNQDVAGTLRTIPVWWRLLTAGLADDVLRMRPNRATWSAVEYAQHSVDVTTLITALLEATLETDGLDFGQEPVPEDAGPTPSSAAMAPILDQMEVATTKLNQHNERANATTHTCTFTGEFGSVAYDGPWVMRHACHDALHHLQDVGRGLHALGYGVPTQHGSVAQINRNDGGVPKVAVDQATVAFRGVVGDRQRSRQHHGRLWQAICLYSFEAIERLQAEGHSIAAGSAGENFTLQGLDWHSLRPNTRIHIGSEVVLELTVPALPCTHNAQWFSDRDFNRMHHVAHPGETRWYASVVQDGAVRTGDVVVVEP